MASLEARAHGLLPRPDDLSISQRLDHRAGDGDHSRRNASRAVTTLTTLQSIGDVVSGKLSLANDTFSQLLVTVGSVWIFSYLKYGIRLAL